MNVPALLRTQIETRIPAAFHVISRPEPKYLQTGIRSIDDLVGGVPLSALTEVYGSQIASSGKTSMLTSLLAHSTQEHFCALVDASDSFDPTTALLAGSDLSKLLWVRCGKTNQKLRSLEQAFKVTDMLLQSGGFGLIAVNLSNIPERSVRNIPMSTWFRFSRVVEKQPTALVFIEQNPHATSCAGLVLNIKTRAIDLPGNLLTHLNFDVEVIRTFKKPVRTVKPIFPINVKWA
jgi:recombination protein RecA